MRKYYLFAIKKDFYKSYYKNSEILYETLSNLYYLRQQNISYGLSIYNQICDVFNKDILINYFHIKNGLYIKKKNKKILVDNIENTEKYIIQINYSCIIIYSNKLPIILRLFNYYNPRIFICDFENNDYFWNNGNISNNFYELQYNLI